MASASPAEGAPVPLAATAVRAELTAAGGGAAAPRGAGAGVPALLLTAAGRPAGGGRGGAVDLRALPAAVERVLFRVPETDRAPGALLRILRADDAAELAAVAVAGDGPHAGGELYRAGSSWAFRALSAAGPHAAQPRVPAQGGPPGAECLGSGAECLPPALRRRLAARTEQAAMSLRTYGAPGARAGVALVLDASRTMSPLYARGAVADVVERVAAAAAVLGGGRLRAWTFATHPARLPDCVPGELPQWLRLHVRPGQLAFLGSPRRRRRGLRPGQIDMRCVGVHNETHRAVAEVRARLRREAAPVPTLVVLVTGGGVRRGPEIERQLREAVAEPVFWQFVGLGRAADYGVLPGLGAPGGGRLPNAGFFALDDVCRTTDAELYDRLLCAFSGWLAAARRTGVPG
ncbi:VWA domain-containing protein [Streptomyces sp. NPDC047002]|uniref:VWA domain-containing protein n=1 Tax=Streptomyces sp. NPDC047002 TaxID=3155475 RepID=UPI0034545C62